jgi:hypothetical protein
VKPIELSGRKKEGISERNNELETKNKNKISEMYKVINEFKKVTNL